MKKATVERWNRPVILCMGKIAGWGGLSHLLLVGVELNLILWRVHPQQVSARPAMSSGPHGNYGIDKNTEIWSTTDSPDWRG